MIGPETALSIEQFYFYDSTGLCLNQLVKKLDFQPRSATNIFLTGESPKQGACALFVDPNKIPEATINDLTQINIEFSKPVKLGAILFSISRPKIDQNPRHILVYSEQKLVFKGDIMNKSKLLSSHESYAALVFCQQARDKIRFVHQPAIRQIEYLNINHTTTANN
jgi:hypothetical protein